MPLLELKNLHVALAEDGTEIVKGVDLVLDTNEVHAIMGPNGSGKSTLAYSIAGHPKYHVTGGSVTLDGTDVLAMSVDERARAGLFLAMQYPVEIPGVSVSNFLRTGEPTALPAVKPVPIYPLTVDGNDVYVDVTTPIHSGGTPAAKEL